MCWATTEMNVKILEGDVVLWCIGVNTGGMYCLQHLWPWKWRQYILLKHWYLPTKQHSINIQENHRISTVLITRNILNLREMNTCDWLTFNPNHAQCTNRFRSWVTMVTIFFMTIYAKIYGFLLQYVQESTLFTKMKIQLSSYISKNIFILVPIKIQIANLLISWFRWIWEPEKMQNM